MSRPTGLSGFPEWLPADRVVEQQVLDRLRRTFELHGYAGIETRAVEPVSQLVHQGETDKEIYVLHRLQADTDEAGTPDDADRLGLHFDLTVPFARYVLEHAGRLQFPFRRYQIQRAWRGERPQEGRFREFTQADVDVVDRETLSFHYEVELPLVIGEALAGLSIPPVRIRVSNRRLAEGFYRGLGIDDIAIVLRAVDRLDKAGPDAVHDELTTRAGCSDAQAKSCLALADITADDASFVDRVRDLGVENELLERGLGELAAVVEGAREQHPGLVVADLRVARGLDYYTGTVYETVLAGHESLGSICSGGRYDALATAADGTTYPGVGLSVGVTRLVSRLVGRRLVSATRSVPTCVLVALADEASRPRADGVARRLRVRGIPAEVMPEPVKYGRQIRFADRRGIPFVWFGGTDRLDEVRDIRSGRQAPADADTWTPAEPDRYPRVVAGDAESADQ